MSSIECVGVWAGDLGDHVVVFAVDPVGSARNRVVFEIPGALNEVLHRRVTNRHLPARQHLKTTVGIRPFINLDLGYFKRGQLRRRLRTQKKSGSESDKRHGYIMVPTNSEINGGRLKFRGGELQASGHTPATPAKHSFGAFNPASLQREDRVLLVLTLIIGAVVGLVVVAFILLTENLGSRLYPADGAAWRRLFMPVAGALSPASSSGALFSQRPRQRHSANQDGAVPPRRLHLLPHRAGQVLPVFHHRWPAASRWAAKALRCKSARGIASVLGRKLGLSPSSVKALVPVGAAAALAAAFNTPIAAVLFTLEEVMGDMHAPCSAPSSSAPRLPGWCCTCCSATSLCSTSRPINLVHPVEFVFYAVLGVAGGLVSVAFVKLLLWQRKWFLRCRNPPCGGSRRLAAWLVGMLGWFLPEVLGVGYGFVDQALNGELSSRPWRCWCC